MALIIQGGKLLLQNGALASGAGCCCGSPCNCNNETDIFSAVVPEIEGYSLYYIDGQWSLEKYTCEQGKYYVISVYLQCLASGTEYAIMVFSSCYRFSVNECDYSMYVGQCTHVFYADGIQCEDGLPLRAVFGEPDTILDNGACGDCDPEKPEVIFARL